MVEIDDRQDTNVESFAWQGLVVLADPTRLRALYLRRLKRALLLRFYAGSLLCGGDQLLLDRVIYSAFCDCQAVDIVSEAQHLLNEARAGTGVFGRSPSRRGD